MQKCILRGCNDSTTTSSLFIAFHSRWISITLHINILLFILLAITSQADANRNSPYYFKWQRSFRRNRPQKIQTNNLNNRQEIIFFFVFVVFSPLNNKIVSFQHLAASKCDQWTQWIFAVAVFKWISFNCTEPKFESFSSVSLLHFCFVFSWIRCFIHSFIVRRTAHFLPPITNRFILLSGFFASIFFHSFFSSFIVVFILASFRSQMNLINRLLF